MISFLEFAKIAAPEKPLTAAQYEFARVAFDGGEPGDDAIAMALWGAPMLTFTDEQRKIVGAVWGRRSGKTWLAAMRLCHLAITVDVSKLARREQAVCPIIATTMNQARHTVNFIRGMLEVVAPRAIIRDTSDVITIRRRTGEVTFQVLPASAGGRALRGKWFPGIFLDECCFFYGSDHKVNDAEIFASARPTILPGGQALLMSTPWSESGLLFDLYKENYSHPKWAIAAYAPTSLMRAGDEKVLGLVEQERARDPINAQREYDAEFLPSTANRFFDSRALERAITVEPIARDRSLPCFFGGDFAWTRDASALVGIQRRQDGVLEVFLTHELMPQKGKPLDHDEVVDTFGSLIRESGGSTLTADHWYERFIAKKLADNGLQLRHAAGGSDGVAQMHVSARAVLGRHGLRMNHNQSLMRQLKDITSTASSGGKLAICNPRYQTGGHGDLGRAFVTAVWASQQGYGNEFGSKITSGRRGGVL